MVHQFDPLMRSDSEFEAGSLELLVIGNRGRLLDPRRTPFSIVEIDLPTGHFHARIEAFEDRGALWEMPLESFDRLQFERASQRAPSSTIDEYHGRIAILDRPLRVECDPRIREQTLARLAERRGAAGDWLRRNSEFLRSGQKADFSAPQGPPSLALDLRRFLKERGLDELEDRFASQYVSFPGSENIKGHRIVCAELGLVPFEGKGIRNPALFDEPWTKERRAAHLLGRLAFVHALFRELGHTSVCLYRGLCAQAPPEPPRNATFVSASFSLDVARSCFGERERETFGLLQRQLVPAERLFMTYLETAQMNRQFLEAEAVLLWEPGNPVF